MATKARVWDGNGQLRRLLVPVGDLRTHPRNPRRGDVKAIAGSLARFGQQRPILALPDGTIVAGNHTFRAAVEEAGWTHIAVVRSDLTDQEVEAYLLADNRHSDLGTYDDVTLLEILQRQTDLSGIGWDDDQVAQLMAQTQDITVPSSDTPPRLDRLGGTHDGVTTFVLTMTEDLGNEFADLVSKLGARWSLLDTPSVVLESLRRHDASS